MSEVPPAVPLSLAHRFLTPPLALPCDGQRVTKAGGDISPTVAPCHHLPYTSLGQSETPRGQKKGVLGATLYWPFDGGGQGGQRQ